MGEGNVSVSRLLDKPPSKRGAAFFIPISRASLRLRPGPSACARVRDLHRPPSGGFSFPLCFGIGPSRLRKGPPSAASVTRLASGTRLKMRVGEVAADKHAWPIALDELWPRATNGPALMQVSVKTDFNAARRALHRAHDDVVKRAAVAALNRAIVADRKQMAQEIRRYRSLRAGTVKQTMLPLKRANYSYLSATMTVLFHAIPLTQYRVHAGKRGVTAQVVPEDGFKPIPHAFQVGAFGNQIFVRRGRARGPLKMLFGPNIPSVLKRPAVFRSLRSVAESTFIKRFKHELAYRLRNMGFSVT